VENLRGLRSPEIIELVGNGEYYEADHTVTLHADLTCLLWEPSLALSKGHCWFDEFSILLILILVCPIAISSEHKQENPELR
jgi:hypothetical protein